MSLVEYVPKWLDFITRSFWGAPGRRSGIVLAWPLTTALTVFAVAAVVVALFSRTPWRRPAVLLVVLCAVQVALTFRTNFHADPGARRLTSAQGRYVFAVLIPVAVLVALGCWRLLARRWEQWLPVAAVATAVVGTGVHLVLARSMLEGYWEGHGASTAQRVEAVVAWSAFPEPVTSMALAAPIVVICAATALLATRAVHAFRLRH